MKQLFLSSFLRCNAYMLKNLKHMHVLVDILFSHAYYLVSFFGIYWHSPLYKTIALGVVAGINLNWVKIRRDVWK